jgi:hypothetical protein
MTCVDNRSLNIIWLWADSSSYLLTHFEGGGLNGSLRRSAQVRVDKYPEGGYSCGSKSQRQEEIGNSKTGKVAVWHLLGILP